MSIFFTSEEPVNIIEYPHNSITLMRHKIVDFIKDSPSLPEDRSKNLEKFVKSAPESHINEIYSRMMSVAEASETLYWSNKLKEYIKSNPPKYSENKEKTTPPQFLEKIWGEYMDHNVLYQDELSSYDEKLIPAIYTYWNYNGRPPEDRLPLPKRNRTESIVKHIVEHGPHSLEDVVRAVRAYARREEKTR
jgi:hypothetical protein